MEKVDFLFQYEVKNRELDSICLIASYLIKRGFSVGFINTWDTLYNKPIKYDAKVIVISACYKDGSYDYFTGHAYKFDKVVDLRWEQVLSNSVSMAKVETSWDYSGEALNTRHVCWGKIEKEYLVNKYNFCEDKLQICGYVPLDFYREELKTISTPREKLFEKYKIDTNKKTILFVSSFAYINLPKSEKASGDENNISAMVELQTNTLTTLLAWFLQIIDENEDVQIIYRPHPSEAANPDLLRLSEKDRFYVISEGSIREWILACDILYNWMSTSMIEMFVSRKKTFILRPLEVPEILDMPIYEKESTMLIDNYNDFRKSVLESDSDYTFPIEEGTILKYYDVQEIPSYKRIGDYLIDTLNDDSYHNRESRNKIWNNKNRIDRFKLYKLSSFCENLGGVFLKLYRGTSNDSLDRREMLKYSEMKMRQNRCKESDLASKLKLFSDIIELSD